MADAAVEGHTMTGLGGSEGKPVRRRRPLPGPSLEVVRVVWRRDGESCVVCGVRLSVGGRGWAYSIHHRRGRDRRPDSNTPQNLILVCGASNVDGCHGRIHRDSKTWAGPLGYWLSRVAAVDPLTVPVVLHDGRTVFLTAEGTYESSRGGDHGLGEHF
jgi:hypothetical protein